MNTAEALSMFDEFVENFGYSALPKKMKRQWVEALRSGEYAQASGALCVQRKNEEFARFCCLGVACHIFEDEPWQINKSNKSRKDVRLFKFEHTSADYSIRGRLPRRVRGALTTLNDMGTSFKVVADVIEARL